MNAHREPTADTRTTVHRLDLPAHRCDTGDAARRPSRRRRPSREAPVRPGSEP